MLTILIVKIVLMLLFCNVSNSAPVHSVTGHDVSLPIKVVKSGVAANVASRQDRKHQKRHGKTIILITPNILNLSFNGSSTDDLFPATSPDLPMVNVSFPNHSIGCITGCGGAAMPLTPQKAARDTKDMIMVMMFSLWIIFAISILIFCGFCYCRRHSQNVQLFESPGFDEALHSYVLATFAHAQRMARLAKRKEKLAELELHKTGMLLTKECFVIEAGKKEALEIPSGNSSSINDRPQKEQTSATKVIETQTSILGDDDDDQTDIASDNVSSPIALLVNLPEYYPESTKQYPNGGPRQVPNSCAICLENFSVGDHLCWSANVSCSHAFHFECIIPWCNKIIKEQPTTKSCACPCCRQDFVQFEFEDDEEYCAEAEHSSVTSEENPPQNRPSQDF